MPDAPAYANRLWFMDTQVTIRVSHMDGADGISVLDHQAPFGDSPPLHVHHTEDEVFHILEGEIRLKVGDRDLRAGPGDTLIAPKGVPHTYRVESVDGARWLTVTTGRDFESFVRAVGRPSEWDGLPERSGPPSPEQAERLAAAASGHRIDLVGPPLG